MEQANGTWEGTNTLWLKYPENPLESPAKVVVSRNRIEYSWVYEGEAQTGTFTFSGSGASIAARWIDSWHSKERLQCNGAEQDGVVRVVGSYSAGDGPDWSWRTEFHMDGPDKFNIRMYNILPDGFMPEHAERELLAVIMELTRAASE